jgi:glutaminyl-peptide cyclotransferase
MKQRTTMFLLLFSSVVLLNAGVSSQNTGTPVQSYKIINTYLHDPTAFTEGLIYKDGVLFESTGQYGKSEIRKVNLETGAVIQKRGLPANFFGEGLTYLNGKFYQLTWTAKTAFVYSSNLKVLKTLSYDTQGWGLTNDGKNLIQSDGSSTIYYRNASDFKTIKKLEVKDAGTAIDQINELEWINGEIWANVWYSERVARINPNTGKVNAWIDLKGLKPKFGTQDSDAVLNGIAYDAIGKRIFVTGKYWAFLYEIEIIK